MKFEKTMALEDKHLDVLQNIEFMVVSVYREDPTMEDREAIKALDALVQYQRRVAAGQTPTPPENLSDNEQLAFDRVLEAIAVRRADAPVEEAPKKRVSVLLKKSNTFEDIILACLRKTHKSAVRWNKRNGKQGYLKFVIQYLP